jgi:hypothetical protein
MKLLKKIGLLLLEGVVGVVTVILGVAGVILCMTLIVWLVSKTPPYFQNFLTGLAVAAVLLVPLGCSAAIGADVLRFLRK